MRYNPESETYNTEILCPICKGGSIVAKLGLVQLLSDMEIPIGPESSNYFRHVVESFHCSECQVMFNHPPGRPNMADEILEEVRPESF